MSCVAKNIIGRAMQRADICFLRVNNSPGTKLLLIQRPLITISAKTKYGVALSITPCKQFIKRRIRRTITYIGCPVLHICMSPRYHFFAVPALVTGLPVSRTVVEQRRLQTQAGHGTGRRRSRPIYED